MPDLLFEIGTEEIPAGYIAPALDQLAELWREALADQRLTCNELAVTGTPRRLALWAGQIPQHQDAAREEVVGPPGRIAFDEDGNPTRAALGFAKKAGVAPEDLQLKDTERGEYVCAVKEIPGRPAIQVLSDILAICLDRLVFQKSMYWHGRGPTFARPVRSLLAMFGDEVVPLEFAGVAAGRQTHGHMFLAPGAVTLERADFEGYRDTLLERHVMVAPDARRAKVRSEVQEILSSHQATLQPEDEELIDEVTNLVEWPHAVEGRFEKTFLDVPADVIVEAMRTHQRYFPIRTQTGELQPAFVTISNRTNEQDPVVREGNERVLRARLEDARFFWDEEKDADLDRLVDRLKDVLFLGGLGSNYDRAMRLQTQSERIAQAMALAPETVETAREAGRLAKADLVTGLVGEFPGLQGVVGREIALHQGLSTALAEALAEHYRPRFAGDGLPETDVGIAVSLADKLDVIIGCFSLDLIPSGSQDPYALRRNALGILRILSERQLELPLDQLIGVALDAYDIKDQDRREALSEKVIGFFQDRLTQFALDQGYGHDLLRAAMATGLKTLPDFWTRLASVQRCSKESWWPELVEVVERTWRIHKGEGLAAEVAPSLLTESAEENLWNVFKSVRDEIDALARKREYFELSQRFAEALADPVHRFFDEVFVNVDEPEVKSNRLTLCSRIHRLYADRVADLATMGQT